MCIAQNSHLQNTFCRILLACDSSVSYFFCAKVAFGAGSSFLLLASLPARQGILPVPVNMAATVASAVVRPQSEAGAIVDVQPQMAVGEAGEARSGGGSSADAWISGEASACHGTDLKQSSLPFARLPFTPPLWSRLQQGGGAGDVQAKENVMIAVQRLSGIFQWDGNESAGNPGLLREMYPGKYSLGLNATELSTVASAVGSLQRWGLRTLTNMAYRMLQWHLLLEENAEATRPALLRMHVRIKLPMMLGGFATRWRALCEWQLDGSVRLNTNCDMLTCAVLRDDAHQQNEVQPLLQGGPLADRNSAEIIIWTFPKSPHLGEVLLWCP